MTTMAAAPISSVAARAVLPSTEAPPAIPATIPSIVKVRNPPKLASGPRVLPDRCLSKPTAAPPSAAIARSASNIGAPAHGHLLDLDHADGDEAEAERDGQPRRRISHGEHLA